MSEAAQKITEAPPSKDQLIVAAASKLFLTKGFEITSMDAIAAEAGVSKRTVYSHFHDKDSLFAEVMGSMCRQVDGPGLEDPLPMGDPATALKVAGRMILDRISEPEVIAVMRTVISGQEQFPQLGQLLWHEGPCRMIDKLADFFAGMARQGLISAPEPRLLAGQFMGLISGPYLLPLLLGVAQPATPEEREQVLDRAVATLLQGISLHAA